MLGLLKRPFFSADVQDADDDEGEQAFLKKWAEQQLKIDAAHEAELLASGELVEAEELPGVSAVHWAPFRPRATTAPPTSPGFYAQRRRGTSRWSIVEVIAGPEGVLWWAWGPREPAVRVDDSRTFGRFEWSDQAYLTPAEKTP